MDVHGTFSAVRSAICAGAAYIRRNDKNGKVYDVRDLSAPPVRVRKVVYR